LSSFFSFFFCLLFLPCSYSSAIDRFSDSTSAGS
jgi:hypothetical protein